jgi:hypothetical protein
MGKLAAEKISPKELGYLRQSLINIHKIKELFILMPMFWLGWILCMIRMN